jgi:hypothetical protein
MVEPLSVKGPVIKDYHAKTNIYTLLVIFTGALTGLLLGYDNGECGIWLTL